MNYTIKIMNPSLEHNVYQLAITLIVDAFFPKIFPYCFLELCHRQVFEASNFSISNTILKTLSVIKAKKNSKN